MLNIDYKEQAIRDLKRIDQEYTVVLKKAISDMERLQNTRTIAVRTIQYVERYIMSISNKPRNYEIRIGEVKLRYTKFINAVKEIQQIENNANMEKNGVAGVLGGVGIATLGATAAMAVAMTFGTASTGTAIATLSGAAATNAALAWLGGGALTVGGAGIAGGQALLSLAGPVGWAISGVSIAASLLAINMSNEEIARKAEESVVAIKKEMQRIKEINAKVVVWNAETKELSNLITRKLNEVKRIRKKDYNQFTDDEWNEIISLINSTEVLSKKMGDKLER